MSRKTTRQSDTVAASEKTKAAAFNRLSNAITAAADGVRRERGTVAEWETTKAAAEAELVRLEAVAGDEVLADPEAAMRLPRQMQEQRDRMAIADRALAAQRSKVAVSERAYLLAEADMLADAVAAVAADLDAHEARTASLLAELEQHEGPYVPRGLLDDEIARTQQGTRTIELTRSEQLREQLYRAGLPVLVLREMAEGREPHMHPSLRDVVPADVYPECVWGPAALVPAPAYLRSVESQRVADQQRQSAIDIARRRVSDLQDAIAKGERVHIDVQDWTRGRPPALEEQLVEAERTLANLLNPVGA